MFPLLIVSVREQTTVHWHFWVGSWHLLSSIVRPASEKALSDAVLAAGTPTSDCAINSVKMNTIFSLPLVIFCHIIVPIRMVLPWSLSVPNLHHHGFTVDFIPIPAVLPQLLSPLPTAVLPLSPIPMQFSTWASIWQWLSFNLFVVAITSHKFYRNPFQHFGKWKKYIWHRTDRRREKNIMLQCSKLQRQKMSQTMMSWSKKLAFIWKISVYWSCSYNLLYQCM